MSNIATAFGIRTTPTSTSHHHDRLIFAYHPHGLLPAGAAYFHLLPDFRSFFPHLNVVTLVASAVFLAPGVRDLVSWFGCRPVFRHTFRDTLRERGAVVLCPGGQQELVWAYKISAKEVHLVVRHLGFIKMAILQQASLVPVVVFGEVDSITSVVDTPRLHHVTYKRFGFPIPFIVGGRWRILPFPKPKPLTFVVGRPVTPALPAWARSRDAILTPSPGQGTPQEWEAWLRTLQAEAWVEATIVRDVMKVAGHEEVDHHASHPPATRPTPRTTRVLSSVEVPTMSTSTSTSTPPSASRSPPAAASGLPPLRSSKRGPDHWDWSDADMGRVWRSEALQQAAERVARVYFSRVVELFDKHKTEAGYGDWRIVLHDEGGKGKQGE